LATVLGQDLETGEDGVLRIARKVAPDRVISTVDPQARHGHKTNHRGFDGYKGHIAIDSDAEIITATAVTAGNAGDIEPAAELLSDLFDAPPTAIKGAVTGRRSLAPLPWKRTEPNDRSTSSSSSLATLDSRAPVSCSTRTIASSRSWMNSLPFALWVSRSFLV